MAPNHGKPEEASSLVEKGIALVEAEDFDAARLAFNDALEVDPRCAKAYCGRGTVNRLLGNLNEAIEDYDAAIAIDAQYARAFFNRGVTQIQLGVNEEALVDFNSAISLESEPAFYYYRANCFRNLERFDDVLRDLDTCIEMDPKRPQSYLDRGITLLHQGKAERGILDLEEAIALNLPNSRAYVWLSHHYSSNQQYERSTSVLDDGLEKFPDCDELHFRRGMDCFYVDDFESAVVEFDKTVGLKRDHQSAIHWRGSALSRLGDYEEAIADFSTVIAMCVEIGENVDVLVARGKANLEMHEFVSAIEDLTKAIDLDPENSRAYTLRARARWSNDDVDIAMTDLDQALLLKPENRSALGWRSKLFTEQGDFKSAEAGLDLLEEINFRRTEKKNMAQKRTRVSLMIATHFEPLPLADLVITERQFPFRVRADLQHAVEELFDENIVVEEVCGIKREHSYGELSFSDLLFPNSNNPAVAVPHEYEEVDIGEAEPKRCLKNSLWLLCKDEVKYAVLLTQKLGRGSMVGMQFHIAVPQGDDGAQIAQDFFKHLERSVAESKSYRGKILSLELADRYSGMSSGIQVQKLRHVDQEQVVLPAKTLELLDRNIIQFSKQREKLNELGLSTKKGLLFYGPPGTGKTHTIHYLAGAMKGHTTLLISAEQIGSLGEYMILARLLQPSIVVIEDADLIARERTQMNSVCEEVLLNKLLNEMDGLRPETAVFFILTTNRPEALEGALASRPGRIDQAIEFPLPDDQGRAKLISLYSKKMDVPADVVAETVKRTDRVSASFIKELMRRAAQFNIQREGSGKLNKSDIDAALEELLFTGGSLNRRLLGMQTDPE